MLIEFKNRKLNIQKLKSFGFVEQNDGYAYSVGLADGQLRLTLTVSKDGKVNTKVVDVSSEEEYVLHLVPGAVGPFVGRVKTEYEAQLERISSDCFDSEVFKNSQAKSIIAHVADQYGNEPEYLWEKFPDNAIVRRSDNGKWYIALLTVSGRKLNLDTDEKIEIIDLRMKTEDVEKLVDGRKYFPGYHMNKKHWITVCLDGTVSLEEIYGRISDSYNLAGSDKGR